MTKEGRGSTPATVALSRAGVAFRLLSYDHDPAVRHFGDEAVAALGIDSAQTFKTLIADCGQHLAAAIVPVAGKLDLKALAKAVGAKRASLAEATTAQRATGYVLGGISPFGQRTRLPTVLDTSALDFDTVFVSGGKRGLDLALSPVDLVRVLDATVAPIGSR